METICNRIGVYNYITGFITQVMQVAFSKGNAIVAGIPVILHPF
jgi:hypothetical protein